ncbi:hypothetical protein RVM26_15180 [Halomonas sp. KM072]
MLIVCRTKAPRRELTVTGSQYHRVRRVEMPVKMGCSRRSASPWLVLPGMRSAVETESAVRKCSLAVIGEVSALASRNQVNEYGPGPQHIAIEVDNVEGVCKELESEGLTFSTQIIKGSDLIQRFTVRCPNSGVMIEFIERNEEEGFSEKNVEDLFRQLEASDSY